MSVLILAFVLGFFAVLIFVARRDDRRENDRTQMMTDAYLEGIAAERASRKRAKKQRRKRGTPKRPIEQELRSIQHDIKLANSNRERETPGVSKRKP